MSSKASISAARCLIVILGMVLGGVTTLASAAGALIEYNPTRTSPLRIGPQADRIVIGFRAGEGLASEKIERRGPQRSATLAVTETQTSVVDVANLVRRTGVSLERSRQLTASMHVLFLPKTLYGADVVALLASLRTDAAVAFADVDERRYPQSVQPNDPLFVATPGATGQWYLMTPSANGDAAATDTVSAWGLTVGSGGTVIADVDTGVRFDHPDLLRAAAGGRLLPGYDFVDQDYSRTTSAPLGTFYIANDGDGWDPDPSDPGDWISSTDQANPLFPASDCPAESSSWHGTRVSGILGAIANNGTGIAGMTWYPYLLPVRALGKCGGYDSDIITAMRWAAGLPITGIPDNPYPADIINLSLGGTGACPSDYADAVTTLTGMGVLIVASAGNGGASVGSPANCPGVLAVAGLRNVGTKVGYSSFGAEVGIAAPAGNCLNGPGCLRSIDTTANSGSTVPASNIYTNQSSPNLGTSFSAPIVSGIAALMRAVNANLSPAQLTARMKSSATVFPQPTGTPVCPMLVANSGECACPNDGSQCGAGMVNAFSAVNAAMRPIAAVAIPVAAGNSGVFDASGSAAACGRSIVAFSWSATGGVTVTAGATSARATISSNGTAGTLTLTVTDSTGADDSAAVIFNAGNASSSAPSNAGTSASACPKQSSYAAAPTVAQAFAPTSTAIGVAATLTITFANTNSFPLLASFNSALPSGLAVGSAPTPATTCTGTALSLTVNATNIVLTGAEIPANGSCAISLNVSSAIAGSYVNSIATGALTAGAAGISGAASTATLIIAPPVAPTTSEAISAADIAQNGVSILTIMLANPNGFTLTNIGFSQALPANVLIPAAPVASTTCGGALTVGAAGITLAGGALAANASCNVVFPVTAGAVGDYAIALAANAVTSAQTGANSTAASVTLDVTVPIPPTVDAAFSSASIAQNASVNLTFTLSNANNFALTDVALNEMLPANLLVAAAPAASTTCGGSLSASGGSASLTGGSVPPDGSCTVVLPVTAAATGSYAVTLAANSVTSMSAGGNTAPATATLNVTAAARGGGGGALDSSLLLLLGLLLLERGRLACDGKRRFRNVGKSSASRGGCSTHTASTCPLRDRCIDAESDGSTMTRSRVHARFRYSTVRLFARFRG